jgi:hypothetical protein
MLGGKTMKVTRRVLLESNVIRLESRTVPDPSEAGLRDEAIGRTDRPSVEEISPGTGQLRSVISHRRGGVRSSLSG